LKVSLLTWLGTEQDTTFFSKLNNRKLPCMIIMHWNVFVIILIDTCCRELLGHIC